MYTIVYVVKSESNHIYVSAGYIAYTGLVVVDSIHNNPVMNVFVYLMSLAAEKAKHIPVEEQLQHSFSEYSTL